MLQQANVNAMVFLSYLWQQQSITAEHPSLQDAYAKGAHHFGRAAECAERGYEFGMQQESWFAYFGLKQARRGIRIDRIGKILQTISSRNIFKRAHFPRR
ncbi:hypothetical protein CMO91_01680 [Candidatus Woesearchaeota archaeon]|nr:hypothetical protein [Candidatus Woesearchaeota archaeon]